MVGGQFHDERSGIAREHLRLLQDDTGNDDGGHAEEIGTRGDPRRTTEDRARDQGDERRFRAAGDERRRDDRHAAVAFAFNCTGGHDAGDAAARADENRNEALAGEPEPAEHTVEHEGDTRHVAARLQEGQ